MAKKRKLKAIDLHKFVTRIAQRGSIPGTVEYIGKPRQAEMQINLTAYDEGSFSREQPIGTIEEMREALGGPGIKWFQVTGVHQAELLSEIGKLFELVSLDLEDIANTTQRPRIEERDDYIFMVFKVLQIISETNEVSMEQVSLVVGNDYMISFHETYPIGFEVLRNRILASKGRIRKMKSDYLAFTIIDLILDHYFSLIEDIGDRIEETEVELIKGNGISSQEDIYKIKRRLGYVKKTIWPTREVLNQIHQSDHPLIHEETRMYFRNNYDHTIQIIETLESLRDLTSGMMDLYLSTVSFRMNEIMKVLTIFSTIFIPLTFFAGVYGMNFKYLPELEWRNGYFYFWGIILIITLLMLYFFRRKKWL